MFPRAKADQLAPAQARERCQQRHRPVAHGKRVSDREHDRQRNDLSLRRILLARALDPAWIAADHLVIRGGLNDRMQEPVGLGHGDRPERPCRTRAGIQAFLAPAANRTLVYIAPRQMRASGVRLGRRVPTTDPLFAS
jgi:hypothetical protein